MEVDAPAGRYRCRSLTTRRYLASAAENGFVKDRPSPQDGTRLLHLRELAKDRTLTLLTATKRPEISEAVVLADLLGA